MSYDATRVQPVPEPPRCTMSCRREWWKARADALSDAAGFIRIAGAGDDAAELARDLTAFRDEIHEMLGLPRVR